MTKPKSEKPRIAALMPMRHQSERVTGKNYRLLAGKPLYAHMLETLLACPEIDEVVVDTDSPVIFEGLEKNYPQVTRIERPENLRSGMVPMNDILLHDTGIVEADYYLQTHSTNPLLKPETVSKAIDTFLTNLDTNDSLFSVTRLQIRLYWGDGSPVNHNLDELLRTQDLPAVYEENSCIFMFSREILVARNHRLGYAPMMFEIDGTEAWDIDEEFDFQIADFLMQQRVKSGENKH